MKEDNETLALRSIERSAEMASQFDGFKGSVTRDPDTNRVLFCFSLSALPLSTDMVGGQLRIDPLPFARSMIELNEKANARTDEDYLGYAVFQMIGRYADLVGISALEAGFGTQCALGPIIRMDDIGHREIDSGFFRADYKKKKGIFSQLSTARSEANGRATKQGNQSLLGANAESRACEAVSNAMLRIKNMKKRYRAMKKDWDRQHRSVGSNAAEWRKHWEEVAGPKEYGRFSFLALFCPDNESKRSDDVFIACAHIAPFFDLQPLTLESKYKAWKSARPSSKSRAQTA